MNSAIKKLDQHQKLDILFPCFECMNVENVAVKNEIKQIKEAVLRYFVSFPATGKIIFTV